MIWELVSVEKFSRIEFIPNGAVVVDWVGVRSEMFSENSSEITAPGSQKDSSKAANANDGPEYRGQKEWDVTLRYFFNIRFINVRYRIVDIPHAVVSQVTKMGCLRELMIQFLEGKEFSRRARLDCQGLSLFRYPSGSGGDIVFQGHVESSFAYHGLKFLVYVVIG
jgi:hypothetical protein